MKKKTFLYWVSLDVIHCVYDYLVSYIQCCHLYGYKSNTLMSQMTKLFRIPETFWYFRRKFPIISHISEWCFKKYIQTGILLRIWIWFEIHKTSIWQCSYTLCAICVWFFIIAKTNILMQYTSAIYLVSFFWHLNENWN